MAKCELDQSNVEALRGFYFGQEVPLEKAILGLPAMQGQFEIDSLDSMGKLVTEVKGDQIMIRLKESDTK